METDRAPITLEDGQASDLFGMLFRLADPTPVTRIVGTLGSPVSSDRGMLTQSIESNTMEPTTPETPVYPAQILKLKAMIDAKLKPDDSPRLVAGATVFRNLPLFMEALGGDVSHERDRLKKIAIDSVCSAMESMAVMFTDEDAFRDRILESYQPVEPNLPECFLDIWKEEIARAWRYHQQYRSVNQAKEYRQCREIFERHSFSIS